MVSRRPAVFLGSDSLELRIWSRTEVKVTRVGGIGVNTRKVVVELTELSKTESSDVPDAKDGRLAQLALDRKVNVARLRIVQVVGNWANPAKRGQSSRSGTGCQCGS